MRASKTILILIVATLIVGSAIYIHAVRPQSNPSSLNSTQTTLNPIFKNVNETIPSANWTQVKVTTQQTLYGNLTGQEETGQITSDKPSADKFEKPDYLSSIGYQPDNMLAAGGPGAQIWGYKKITGGKSQVVIFSYRTQGTSNPNEPIQFNCPCKVDLKVFVSDPFDEK